MALQFHPLPAEMFPEEARPYINRLNRELRDLFALEGTLRQPVQTKRSDNTIARRSEVQVDISRITPEISQVAESGVTGPASSVVGNIATWANIFGTSLADGLKAGADLVTGPASAVSGNVAGFTGTGGKVIFDTGLTGASLGIAVTAASTFDFDNFLMRSDGTGRGAQIASGISISDTNVMGSSGAIHLVQAATSTTPVENLLVAPLTTSEVVRLTNTRPLKGTFEGQVEAVYRPASATLAYTSRIEGPLWSLGINAASVTTMTIDMDETTTSPAMSPYASITADNDTALRFFAGQDAGNMGTGVQGMGFYCDGSDAGVPAANFSVINFEKLSNDLSTTGDFVFFSHTSTWGSSSHWVALWNSTAAATQGGFTQAHRWDTHNHKVGQYLPSGSRWIKVDGLPGGRFGFIDAGASEPVD